MQAGSHTPNQPTLHQNPQTSGQHTRQRAGQAIGFQLVRLPWRANAGAPSFFNGDSIGRSVVISGVQPVCENLNKALPRKSA